jgi:hypothetical protein
MIVRQPSTLVHDSRVTRQLRGWRGCEKVVRTNGNITEAAKPEILLVRGVHIFVSRRADSGFFFPRRIHKITWLMYE